MYTKQNVIDAIGDSVSDQTLQNILDQLFPPVNIAIHVRGGLVESVQSDHRDVYVTLVDWDNIAGGDEEPEVPDSVCFEVF